MFLFVVIPYPLYSSLLSYPNGWEKGGDTLGSMIRDLLSANQLVLLGII